MKVYLHATHLFLIALLVALFASYSYGASSAMIKTEIGEKKVVRIKQKLKEPLLTLLASSEFASFKELERRIDDALTALNSFKNEINEDMEAPAVHPEISITPAPMPEAPITAPPMPEAPATPPTQEPTVAAPTMTVAPEQPVAPTPMPEMPGMPSAPEAPAVPEVPAAAMQAPVTPPPPAAPTPLPPLQPLPPLPPASA